jgi:hypothetical protein
MNAINYRKITLMEVVGKVFSDIVGNQIETVFMDKIDEEQGGLGRKEGA